MDIQFQGFSPVFSDWLLWLMLIGVCLFSWWSYSYLSSISSAARWSLTALRATSLVILILLLFNPFVEQQQIQHHQPAIAVYLDDSESMGVTRQGYSGPDAYRAVLENFSRAELDPAELQIYRFGGQVQPVDSLNLLFEESVTNIDEVMQHLQDQDNETVAAILVSDGIITRGRHPVYAAEDLDIPVYTVPVGDTSSIRDVSITDVLTNETGFTDTRQPVNVSVTQEGFPGETFELLLMEDGREISRQTLESGDEERSILRAQFELSFNEEGIHHYEIQVAGPSEEISTENNTYPFSVHVIDETTTIVHLAFDIHPDVRLLRSLISSDPNLNLNPLTWTGERFIESDPDLDPDEIDLIILHGALPPAAGLTLPEDVPLIQFLTPEQSADGGTALALPVSFTSDNLFRPIHLLPAADSRNHPVMDLEHPDYTRLPPLGHVQIDTEPGPTVTSLYLAQVQGESTGSPVILVEESGDRRQSLVAAHGWYALNLAGHTTFIERLFSNLISWTYTRPDEDRLTIGPGRQVYQEGDQIIFSGSLTGETGAPETRASIGVDLRSQDGEDLSYTMRHQGQGLYNLMLNSLPDGTYQYTVDAQVNGLSIEKSEGEFVVTPSVVEYLNTRRDDTILRSIAETTGGLFLENQQPDLLLSHLRDQGLLDPIEEHLSSFRFLHQHLIWFLLVLLLLTSEWLLRRRLSLP